MWLQVPTMQKLYFIRNHESMLKHAQTVFPLHQSGRRSWNIWWKTYTICWSLKSLRRWLCSHNRCEVLHVVLVGWLAIQEVQLLRKHASSGHGSGVAQRRISNKTEPVLLPKECFLFTKWDVNDPDLGKERWYIDWIRLTKLGVL